MSETVIDVTGALIWATLIIEFLLSLKTIAARCACDCGRSRPGYFSRRHVRGPVMFMKALLTTVRLLAYVVGGAVIVGIAAEYIPALGAVTAVLLLVGMVMFGLSSFLRWRAWWLHEKDRMKRAAGALGRVVVDLHGRLRIASPRPA